MAHVRIRHEVPHEETWALESVYTSNEEWEKDFSKLEEMIPSLGSFQGRMSESAQTLLQALQARDASSRLGWRLVIFASLRRDQDMTNNTYQAMNSRIFSLLSRLGAASSYMNPEILAIPEERLAQFLDASSELQVYKHELDDLLREKQYVRSPEVEELLAQSGEVSAAPRDIFGMLFTADMPFPPVRDEEGNEVRISETHWGQLRESSDRSVRENAFKALFGTYQTFQNTYAAILTASVKKDIFYAQARRYPSARAMSLSGNNIPESVYDNLISTVHRNLPTLHRYLRLRKRLLGLDELHMWDLYNPMVAEVNKKIPYREAVQTIIGALAPLGSEYVRIAQEGLTTGRWVDIYPNEGKRSGAYSSGSYDTIPFILMNYNDTLESMFTLAHELGHSMHAYLTRQHQPFTYGSFTIFVTEVASTFNEIMMSDYLLKQTSDRKLRMYLLNHALEQFRTTLYRQTLMAEFEMLTHRRAEAGEALTAEVLRSLYYELNQKYYGAEGVVVDEEIGIEWARIPHFYGAFYVYQYATGLSAAVSLVQQVLSEGSPAVERYLGFLKKGTSDYSINLLRGAGVDMAKPEPVQRALDLFAKRLDEMEALLD